MFCLPRTYVDTKCVTFDPDFDQCLICQDQSILSQVGKCVDFPSGIQGCRLYNENAECIGCLRDRYLSQSQCLQVNVNLLKKNCVLYSGDGLCSECEKSYFLFNNECFKTNALNCVTYKDVNTCSSCPKGYVTKMDMKGVVNCLPINKPNCLEI